MSNAYNRSGMPRSPSGGAGFRVPERGGAGGMRMGQGSPAPVGAAAIAPPAGQWEGNPFQLAPPASGQQWAAPGMAAAATAAAAREVGLTSDIVAGLNRSSANPEAIRSVTPYGNLFPMIRNPQFTPFEREFRVQANNTWFNPSIDPRKPVIFEIGGIQVPDSLHLLVTEYRFQMFRVSGCGVDTRPLEPEALSTYIAFDLTINGNDRGQHDCKFQLDPVPVPVVPTQFVPPATASSKRTPITRTNEVAASQAFNAPGGAGTSALPNRPDRMGPTEGPFTIYVYQRQTFSGSANIMRALPIPIAFIQLSVRGLLIDTVTAESLEKVAALR